MMCDHRSEALFSVCKNCQNLVEPSSERNFFVWFNLEKTYHLDLKTLENQYFNLMRKLHPDRFFGKDQKLIAAVTQWSAKLNEAYQILRSPEKRGPYLLSTLGFSPDLPKGQLPPELVEEYFDLQDTGMDSSSRQRSLRIFLEKVKVQIEKDMADIQKQFSVLETQLRGQESAAPTAQKILASLARRSYLNSLAVDLEGQCPS